MEKMIVYYPYRRHKWFAYMCNFFTLVLIVGAVLAVPSTLSGSIFLALYSFLGVYLTKRLYDASKAAVFLMKDGVGLFGDKYGSTHYVSYDDIKYVYLIRSYKGDVYYILSSEVYDTQSAKRLIYRVSDSSRLYANNAIVIYMDKFKEPTQVKKWIEDSGYLPPITKLQ